MTRLAILASHPVQYYAPLFRALAKELDLTVFYAHDATAQDQARAGFGVEFSWDVDLLSGYRHVFLTNVARNPGLGRFTGVDTPEIARCLREGRFDALLLMGWYLKCFIQGLVAAKLLGLPVMVRGDSHLDTPRSALKVAVKRAIYPHFLRRFDAALVVGRRNRAYWEHYGYPPDRIFYTPHCVDNAFFAERATSTARAELRDRLRIATSAHVVMFAGKLVPFKRPIDVVEGIARVRAQGLAAELLVVGAGELEDPLRARATELGVPLHLLGFCNQTEMPTAYAAADLLILPSDGRETWGLVVNEALACGRSVLVSDRVGCAPDVEEQLGTNVIYAMGDVSKLAAHMASLLLDPPPSMDLARAAAHFSLQKAADGTLTAATLLSMEHSQN